MQDHDRGHYAFYFRNIFSQYKYLVYLFFYFLKKNKTASHQIQILNKLLYVGQNNVPTLLERNHFEKGIKYDIYSK